MTLDQMLASRGGLKLTFSTSPRQLPIFNCVVNLDRQSTAIPLTETKCPSLHVLLP